MNEQINLYYIEMRLHGLAEATSFCLNSFAAYVENKESGGSRQTHYADDVPGGILFLNKLIQEAYEQLLKDIKSVG